MPVRAHWVITLVGQDRTGLVDRLSEWVSQAGGDWLDSHLTHVGDHFAGILEVATPEDRAEGFLQQADAVQQETGLVLAVRRTGVTPATGTLFAMTCIGQDRPGLVKALTDLFLGFGANVETLDTTYQNAPMSGEHLFEARFRVRLPADTDLQDVEEGLSSIGEDLMLDVQVQK